MAVKMAYTVLARVNSSSEPNKIHEVRLGHDGTTYCTCKGWVFNREIPKTCKHLKAFAKAPVPMQMKSPSVLPLAKQTSPVAEKILNSLLSLGGVSVLSHRRARMIEYLESELAAFVPPTQKVAQVEAMAGVRMITLED